MTPADILPPPAAPPFYEDYQRAWNEFVAAADGIESDEDEEDADEDWDEDDIDEDFSDDEEDEDDEP